MPKRGIRSGLRPPEYACPLIVWTPELLDSVTVPRPAPARGAV